MPRQMPSKGMPPRHHARAARGEPSRVAGGASHREGAHSRQHDPVLPSTCPVAPCHHGARAALLDARATESRLHRP